MQERILDIVTDDGHQFRASLYPSSSPAAPVLIFLAALGTPARVYARFGKELAQHGIALCAPDWRGLGSSSLRADRRTDFGYRELLEQDIPAVLAAVRRELPAAPVWLGGHSLGGQLGLLSAAAAQPPVTGIALIASGTVHLPCYPVKLRFGIRTMVLLARLSGFALGYFPGQRIGFGGREARGLMRDWGAVAHSGHYRIRGSRVDYEAALRQLALPVLAVNFAADDWAPARAGAALLDKAPQARRAHWQWGKKESAGTALDHFSWVRQPQLIAPALASHIHTETTRKSPTP